MAAKTVKIGKYFLEKPSRSTYLDIVVWFHFIIYLFIVTR